MRFQRGPPDTRVRPDVWLSAREAVTGPRFNLRRNRRLKFKSLATGCGMKAHSMALVIDLPPRWRG